MTRSPSLRLRLMLGAILWAIGLFTVASVLITQVMYRHPEAPVVFHRLFLHVGPISALALVATIAGLLVVRRGISPINQLRARLAAVHAGDDRHVSGRYPAEVQPLVDDLNALLDHRERTVRNALAKAADLAHGLKTPLAVLAQEADRAESAGYSDLASTIRHEVDRMRRQVEYHLAHARAAASRPDARCPVHESAEALTRTLLRLHAGRGLSIDVEAPASLLVRVQREDLDEMLGNLLDNACVWARARVAVAAAADDGRVVITVDDDGPGLDPALWSKVLQRGVRADEAGPGTGLGLAIVQELTRLYGGLLSLERSPLGGLRAALALPAA